jgi:hypothetical protein
LGVLYAELEECFEASGVPTYHVVVMWLPGGSHEIAWMRGRVFPQYLVWHQD